MANQELVDLLRQGSAHFWNMWRLTHPDVSLDLFGADLHGINLEGAIINRADLRGANLREANLFGANLTRAYLTDANLHHANLGRANLTRVDFSQANLTEANLKETDLFMALLLGANLSHADLSRANLHETLLHEANFNAALVGWTIFGNVDLHHVRLLDTVIHRGPSTIGIDTINRSQGTISDVFLRNAGIPETFITYARSLPVSPIDYYTCFISYSTHDEIFARRLHADLRHAGVRCWFAPEDLKIGDHYHQRIDDSIRLYDKLILILSEQAVKSAWVEREVVSAREKEDQRGRAVLFPVRLDDAVMDTTTAWAADVRRRWHIGDFTRWKDHDTYQQAFERLLRDLKADIQQ